MFLFLQRFLRILLFPRKADFVAELRLAFVKKCFIFDGASALYEGDMLVLEEIQNGLRGGATLGLKKRSWMHFFAGGKGAWSVFDCSFAPDSRVLSAL